MSHRRACALCVKYVCIYICIYDSHGRHSSKICPLRLLFVCFPSVSVHRRAYVLASTAHVHDTTTVNKNIIRYTRVYPYKMYANIYTCICIDHIKTPFSKFPSEFTSVGKQPRTQSHANTVCHYDGTYVEYMPVCIETYVRIKFDPHVAVLEPQLTERHRTHMCVLGNALYKNSTF